MQRLKLQQPQAPDAAKMDWVTIGVLTSKSPPKNTVRGDSFAIWTITDLADGEISLFLFGDAFKKHWKEPEGRIFALLNLTPFESREVGLFSQCFEGHSRRHRSTYSHAMHFLLV